MRDTLNLTPNPRVLEMLGHINLPQWRCLAELIDNSIDGFTAAERAGEPITDRYVQVRVPTVDSPDAQVVVRDTGPGMDLDTLEKAARAGWTSNDPVSSLGLFGMGFNIATARLGSVTEVWTSRAGDTEEIGLRIDLNQLRASGVYLAPVQRRPKEDPTTHGTEVVISGLKPDQRAWFAKPHNLRTVRKNLAKTYSELLLRRSDQRFRLEVNKSRVEGRKHCVWSRGRVAERLDDGVAKDLEFDIALEPRRFCTHCMKPLAPGESTCPTGGPNCQVKEIERRLRGWLGVQRYLDESDFGIDFIRNGRKIEIANKDLFTWNDGERAELEYPIDDPRGRGRIVGEVHLDHCRVSYTKDRFERDDDSWSEMVRLLRGDGPLRPNIARRANAPPNASPLYKLYQAFRRSNPPGKQGRWGPILVVKDNDLAKAMAEKFAENQPGYLEDDAWWELVSEQDAAIEAEERRKGEKESSSRPDAKPDSPPEDATATDASTPTDPPAADAPPPPAPQPPASPPPASSPPAPLPAEPAGPSRTPLSALTRTYSHPDFRFEYEVEAFAVAPDDPDLPAGSAWTLFTDDPAGRVRTFLVDPNHAVFKSSTMTPGDALLAELSHHANATLGERLPAATFSAILASFRRVYARDSVLDAAQLIGEANVVLSDIATYIATALPAEENDRVLRSMPAAELERMRAELSRRDIEDVDGELRTGGLWALAAPDVLFDYFRQNPAAFLGGAYWRADAASGPEYDDLVARLAACFRDVIWLSRQTPGSLEREDRDLLIRAGCAVRLLRPDQ